MCRRIVGRGVVKPFLVSHVSQHCPLHADAGRKGMQDRLAALVLECDRNSLRPFSGSICAAALTATGVGLCALTFFYNVGRPVVNAYAEAHAMGCLGEAEGEEQGEK
ncbi:hypothetical protein TcCL_NonESM02292 [Trypanosoma cruzi]|nr:hypothetical protein TcCL_NonESM02292 [Trypanosoma cruzi]